MCKDAFDSNLFYGLIDTGSQLTLLKNSAWIKLGAPSLMNNTHTLNVFGFSCTKIMCSISSEITIDIQIFPATVSVIPSYQTTARITTSYYIRKQNYSSTWDDTCDFSPV